MFADHRAWAKHVRPTESLCSKVSVLASRYDGSTGGARVGLLGPMRMDYSSNLAAVRAVAHYLTRMLEDDDSAR